MLSLLTYLNLVLQDNRAILDHFASIGKKLDSLDAFYPHVLHIFIKMQIKKEIRIEISITSATA